MKQNIIPVLILMAGLSCQAQIANCTPDIGIEIVGNNGVHFCMSKINLNWWSAHSWCRAIGMQLASYNTTCYDANGEEYGYCSSNFTNVANKPDAWLSTAAEGGKAFYLYSGWNWSVHEGGSRKTKYRAFCSPA